MFSLINIWNLVGSDYQVAYIIARHFCFMQQVFIFFFSFPVLGGAPYFTANVPMGSFYHVHGHIICTQTIVRHSLYSMDILGHAFELKHQLVLI